jgi:hypothetical protein
MNRIHRMRETEDGFAGEFGHGEWDVGEPGTPAHWKIAPIRGEFIVPGWLPV